MTQQQGQSLLGFVVLVVDDDADSLNAAMLVIAESFGCGVLSASSCDDALGMLDSGAHVDLVFSDVVMPNKDGVTLAKEPRDNKVINISYVAEEAREVELVKLFSRDA